MQSSKKNLEVKWDSFYYIYDQPIYIYPFNFNFRSEISKTKYHGTGQEW